MSRILKLLGLELLSHDFAFSLLRVATEWLSGQLCKHDIQGAWVRIPGAAVNFDYCHTLVTLFSLVNFSPIKNIFHKLLSKANNNKKFVSGDTF